MSRRRALLAANQPTFNGVELPTEIPRTSQSTEELKNLFSFLNSLTVDGSQVYTINNYRNGRMLISTGSFFTNLYQDGSTSAGESGGGG